MMVVVALLLEVKGSVAVCHYEKGSSALLSLAQQLRCCR